MQVALVGITGYAGMVLYQLLQKHSGVTKINLYDHKLTAPSELNQVVPIFNEDQTEVLPYDDEAIIQKNGVVFFATSAGVTSKVAPKYMAAHFPVIDLSGDMRLASEAQYTKWYHKPAAPAKFLRQTHYGLADFQSAKGQTYIANPGCYATATLLGLAPLVQNNLIEPESIIVDAKSGTTGAGKTPHAITHFTQVDENLQIYKPNQHQHIPEIMQELRSWNDQVPAIQFMTTLVPINRGIMSTIYAKVKAGINEDQLTSAFKETYTNKHFVQYTGTQLPDIKQVVGTNNCNVGFVYNPVTHTITVDSVIDNLLKGAAGQAVQNFNQLFNYKETEGLELQTFLP
ncbi:N-acetyl-gamma-glutamyl-phosphate reductase [Lentilactobacillus sp. TOM.63]|uniref:N-acetyl-gamma-glutamyl-phosphate reductase n=1 Tax=Lentilactobacillus sp. TOM.63 TaxID=3055077 RepID=UPI0025A117FD|nr:N-acetyl-gamma-glutamyl-phosphate reductase [Lentilactobacillus sp. TOM.63]MDM7516836.1 N-acetyl-gamma-glutamyl-phosphate reductase [Lentilactobacillus sp. TOM.63]